MIRLPSSGSTMVADKTATYLKSGVVRFSDPEPKVLGGYPSSSFSRAGLTVNPFEEDGWRQPSPYHGSLTKHEYIRFSYWFQTWTKFAGNNSFLAGIPNLTGLPTSFPAVCDQSLRLARNKGLLALKDQTVNLSVAFAERQKTVELTADAVQTVIDFCKFVFAKKKKRKVKPPKAKKPKRSMPKKYVPPPPSDEDWKKLPDVWLTWRYGVIPTILDVQGAIEALSKKDNGSYNRYMVTARGKSSFKMKEPIIAEQYTGYVGRYYPTTGTVTRRVLELEYGARVRYDAYLTNTLYLQLSEIGITNLTQAAWEAATLSFVADWFLSVGDWLSALDATVPFNFRGGTETTYLKWSGETTLTGANIAIEEHSGPGTHTQFERKTVSGFPFPDLFVLKQNPINAKRLADSIALLIGRVKKLEPYAVLLS